MINGPPEQKEAPRSVDALQGAKTDGTENSVKTAQRFCGVKLEGNLCDARRVVLAPRSGAAPLPRLNSHISNEDPSKGGQEIESQQVQNLLSQARKLGGSACRTAYALRENILHFVDRVGIQHCGFIALTFAGGGAGPSSREATKKFNSFLTGAIRDRYKGGMRVLERGEKRGRVHFHLLADVGRDIRSGVDVEAVQNGDYRTASAAMREEYLWLRRQAKLYGFGFIVNIQPVKSGDQAIAKYLSKYVAKHIGRRELRDKGARLVGYWGHAAKEREVCSSNFAWTSARSKLWRWQVGEFARRNRCVDEEELKAKFGRRWAFQHRDAIMSREPPANIAETRMVNGEVDTLSILDVFHADRVKHCALVAHAIGCTEADVFVAVYQRHAIKLERLEFTVPVFSGQSLNQQQIEAEWLKTVVWKDGRVERNL